LNQLLIPNDGFKAASYKNWILLKLFNKTKFTALAQLAICRIQYNMYRTALKCSVYRALKQLKATFSFIENRMQAYMLYKIR